MRNKIAKSVLIAGTALITTQIPVGGGAECPSSVFNNVAKAMDSSVDNRQIDKDEAGKVLQNEGFRKTGAGYTILSEEEAPLIANSQITATSTSEALGADAHGFYSPRLNLKIDTTLPSKTLHKGDKILIGTVTTVSNVTGKYSNDLGELGNIYQVTNNGLPSFKIGNDIIGDISMTNNGEKNKNEVDIWLNVTQDRNYATIPTGSITLYNSAMISDLYGYKLPLFTRGDSFWVDFLTGDNFYLTNPTIDNWLPQLANENSYNIPSMLDMFNNIFSMSDNNFASNGSSINDWISDQGKTFSRKNEVDYQYLVNGVNLPKKYEYVWLWYSVPVVNPDGKLLDADIARADNKSWSGWTTPDGSGYISAEHQIPLKEMSDNMSSQDILNQLPNGEGGYSKQDNGTYQIAFKVDPNKQELSPQTVENVLKGSYLYNMVYTNQSDRDKMVQNTLHMIFDGPMKGITPHVRLKIWYDQDSTDTTKPRFYHVQNIGKNGEQGSWDGTLAPNGSEFNAELYRFANIRYIDDTTGNTVATDSLMGEHDKSVNYKINIPKGYVLSKNQPTSSKYTWSDDKTNINYTFDNDQKVNDSNPIIIHLTHAKNPVNNVADAIRTIHYVGAGTKTPADKQQKVGFKGTQDSVTQDYSDLQPNGQWDQIVSPDITGYTPDIKVVQSEIPKPNEKKTVTVTYTANNEKAKLRVIDDHTGLELAGYSEEANGKFDTAISFDKNPNDVAKKLENKGYKVVSNSWQDGSKYQDGKNEFVIHVDHTTSAQTESHAQTRTIHYVDGKGNKMGDDVVQKANFTRTGTKDNVTGQIDWKDWTTNDNYPKVSSPVHEGYTPDIKVVQSETPDPNENKTVTVTYTTNDEKAKLRVIDDHTGLELNGYDKEANGKYDTAISFDKNPNDVAKELENKGYKVVSNSWQDGSKYQDGKNEFVIHVDHTTSTQTESHAQTRTIHYVDGKGNKMGDDVVQKANFTRTGTKDNVTGQIDWKDWTTNDKYPEVSSPAHDGYTPDKAKVDAVTPLYGQNQDQTVVYHRNGQGAEITYVDDTTGKVLKHEQAQGKYNDKIVFNSNVPDTIKGYEDQGYVLVSNDFKEQNYSSNNATNKFTVHFKHGTKQVTREKNVSQDIDYQIKENGTTHSVNHYKAPDLKFTQSGIQDNVTKEINWNGTVADQQFKTVNTPTIKGYTPDIKQVPTTNIHVDSKNWNQDQNIKKTITYTPDTETVKVIAKDRDTNKILNQSQLTGTYGSEYHATAPKINGYHLVKSPANASGKFGTNNADVVYLYVKDTPTDKGETTGTPSPDDTSVFNQNLAKQDTKDLPEMSEANMATATLAGLGLLALTGLVPVVRRKFNK